MRDAVIVWMGADMVVLQILLLGMLLVLIPACVGYIFANVDKGTNKLPFQWISGQIVLWAGFQLIAVPMVLKEKSVTELLMIYMVFVAVLLLCAMVLWVQRRKKSPFQVVREEAKSKWYYMAWGGFWILLLFQLLQAILMVYSDGDDAFYIAEATHAANSDTMYLKIPYTGWPTILDARYGLAPFPIWIAILSKVSGMRTVSVAHVVLPIVLISMTYAVYYSLGSKVFSKKKECIPVFLIFTELLVLFGDYSFYTVENFMIARSRQGKAALGNIIIPVLILLLFLLVEKLQESQKIGIGLWLLLAAALTASCLCSTLGALLACMLVGITGLCAAVCYRKWLVLIPMAACCIPCVIYAGLYLLLG